MSQGNWGGGGGGPPPGGGGYEPPGGAPPAGGGSSPPGGGGYGPPGGAPPGGGGYGPPPGGGGYGAPPGGGGYGAPPGGGGYGPPPGGGGYGPPPSGGGYGPPPSGGGYGPPPSGGGYGPPPGGGGYGPPPSGQLQGRQETPFFSDSFVTVTSARAIFRGTTYALANITSVHLSTVKKPTLPLLLGILCLVAGLFLIIANSGTGSCGGVILLAGVVAMIIYFVSKDQHWVRIGTAGGEVNAFGSTNAAHVNEIVAALNNAIIHRG